MDSSYQSQSTIHQPSKSSTPLSITYPSNDYQPSVYHTVYSPQSLIPQLEYALTVNQQPYQPEFPQLDSGLTIPVFKQVTYGGQANFYCLWEHQGPTLQEDASGSKSGNKDSIYTTAKERDPSPNNAPRYVIESQQAAVHNSNSSAQQDALILFVIEQLKTQVVNCTKINLENKSVNDTLTAELERYKEQVKVLKEGQNVDLKRKDNVSDSCAQSVEIGLLKQTLSKHLKENESLMQKVTLLKNDFQKEESRNIDREIASEKHIKELNNIVFKRNQSAQTVHMLMKP
ncbi:hypothetical protein Tco_1213161 [Tanacetum coccineum]